jgi:hypothetical protein
LQVICPQVSSKISSTCCPLQVCCFLGMPKSRMEQNTLELKKTSPTIMCYSIIPRLYCIYSFQEKFMLAAVMPSDSQSINHFSAPLSHHPQSCSAYCNSISISSVLTIHSPTCELTRTEPQQFIHIVLWIRWFRLCEEFLGHTRWCVTARLTSQWR